MKSLLSLSMAACLALSAGYAAAQDTTTNAPATRTATKMDAKKDMSTSDCVEHTNEMKGQKHTDPASGETATKCQDKTNMHKAAGSSSSSNMSSGGTSSSSTSSGTTK